MIEHVDIKNFKCLRDVSLDLAPLTVLIGPNDSGKSSFLESLGLVSRALQSDERALDGRQVSDSLCWRCGGGVIDVVVTAGDLRYALQLEPGYVSVSDSLELQGESFFRKYEPDTYGDSMIRFGECAGDIRDDSDLGATVYRSGWHEYVARAQQSIDSPCDGYAEVFRTSDAFHFVPGELRTRVTATPQPLLDSNGRNLADVLHTLINGPDPEVRQRIDEQLHREIPALAGVFTPVINATGGSALSIEFILNGDTKKRPRIPASQVSDGAMLITAFLALAYSDTPEILLIEEPENGLHPSRLKTVINLLRKMTTGEVGNRPRQVILTTHSPLLLNYVKPEEVRVFSRNGDEGTKVRSMSEVPGLEDLQKTYSTGEIWNLFGEETMFNEVAS